MIEFLHKYWAQLLGGFLAALWVGRISNRVTQLEKEQYVTITMCEQKTGSCQLHIASELSHGTNDFNEIKDMIAEMKKTSEDRHNLIMEHLLK